MWRQGEVCKKWGLALMFTHDTTYVWPQLKPRKSFDIWDTLVEIKSTYKVKEVQPIKHLMCFSCYWKRLCFFLSSDSFLHVLMFLFHCLIDILICQEKISSEATCNRPARDGVSSQAATHSGQHQNSTKFIHQPDEESAGRGETRKSYFIINRKVNLFKCLPSARWSVRRLEKCHGL